MSFRQTRLAVLPALIILIGTGGCNDTAGPATSPPPTAVPLAPSAPPAPPALSPEPAQPHTIEAGATITGTITSQDGECLFFGDMEGWGGLCNSFDITFPASGTLGAILRWSADAPLVLFLKTATGEQIDLSCCNSPVAMQLPVDSGVTYRLEVAYTGRPPGYPNIQPVSYILETALLPPDSQSSRALQAIVYGDDGKTQRLPSARLVIAEGPSAGTVATFDETTGLYEFAGLPPGYARIIASASGFIESILLLPVGTNLPRQVVLRRREPLPNATGSLSGVAWVDASRTAAYTGVKIEILDGLLAGAFTFTDDNMALYSLRGLPLGPMQVRASSASLQSQTLSVVVSENGRLDFIMSAR
jgi:hypothetical protein